MMNTKNYSADHHHLRGFTLVELSIVLAIVALLLGGLLPVMSAQVEQQRRNETRKQLNEIKEALIGFAVINGRLPCPADGTIASGLANAGVEQATCGTGSNGGAIPWVTLGVTETDAWGMRFTYRVTPDFANAGAPFRLNSTPNLDVGITTNSTDTSIASDVPAIVVSHGPNGLGAFVSTGGAPPTTATGDELDNAATNNNNHFVSHDPIQNGFDDIVIWLSPNTLFNRMVTAGKLP